MPSDSSIGIGNGLVDIAALTALIGSSTAESLVLGDRDLGGLGWSAASAFGVLSLIKGCICGASPGWLRDTLGVRNPISDAALGMTLPLRAGHWGHERSRRNLPMAIGIISQAQESCHDVYAFDQPTSQMINSIPPSKPGDFLIVCTFSRYDFLDEAHTRKIGIEYLTILSSLVKMVELYVLWIKRTGALFWVAGSAWLYFFVASIVLLCHRILSRRLSETKIAPRVDMIAGDLPSVNHAGGDRRVILGAIDNDRLTGVHRLMWAFGGVVCTGWLVATYMLLSETNNDVILLWSAFQIIWLLCRLLFYHFVEAKLPVSHRLVPQATHWDLVDTSTKGRVFALMSGLSQYQVFIHPRGPYSYQEDTLAPAPIRHVIQEAQCRLHAVFPLPDNIAPNSTIEVQIQAVIGDTTLTATSWILGSKVLGMDLYDSCLIFIQTKASIMAIPSVRILSERAPDLMVPDVEQPSAPQFRPRSASNTGEHIIWWFWIPCPGDKWLQLTSENMKFLGSRTARIVTDSQITETLQRGDLNISLTKVDDLRDIVGLSRQSGELLMQFFK